MPIVEIDQATDDFLAVASRVAGISKGQVVAQLVSLAKAEPAAAPADRFSAPTVVFIHAVYEGHRTNASYFRGAGRIEILDGPLVGESFKTPSEAAKAVVSFHNPEVSANRNGWTFWLISANGAPLQTIRYEDI